jgi:hypothetical protein
VRASRAGHPIALAIDIADESRKRVRASPDLRGEIGIFVAWTIVAIMFRVELTSLPLSPTYAMHSFNLIRLFNYYETAFGVRNPLGRSQHWHGSSCRIIFI